MSLDDDNADADAQGGGHGRRTFIRNAAVGGAIAGGVWVAPAMLTISRAGAVLSGPCPAPNRFFGWNATGYSSTVNAATGWRNGSPGTGGPINVSDWSNHPTYTTAALTTAASDVRLRFGFVQDSVPPGTCTSTTYLNTATNSAEAHGVSAQGTSAVSWQAYRFSKDGLPDTGTCNPPVGQILRFRITFTDTSNVPVTVKCPTIAIADIDNWLTSTQGTGLCVSPFGATNTSYWMDQVFFQARSVAGGANDVTVSALATGTNLNGSPSGTQALQGGGTGWRPVQCDGVPQTAGTTTPPGTIPNPVPISDVYLQVQGACQQIDICYQSGWNDTTDTGRQHIGIGPITFAV